MLIFIPIKRSAKPISSHLRSWRSWQAFKRDLNRDIKKQYMPYTEIIVINMFLDFTCLILKTPCCLHVFIKGNMLFPFLIHIKYYSYQFSLV